MKLQQNQVWAKDGRFIRIVRLERLQVDYKVMDDLVTREGKHHSVTKKEFCRLIKGATLQGAGGPVPQVTEAEEWPQKGAEGAGVRE